MSILLTALKSHLTFLQHRATHAKGKFHDDNKLKIIELSALIASIEDKEQGDSIAITWHIDDVRLAIQADKNIDVSPHEAREVLSRVLSDYNPQKGITFETFTAAYEVLNK